MTLRLYANHHVHAQIINGVRNRGLDVITAYEDARQAADDPAILDRATDLGRVLFSQDTDLLTEAARRQRRGLGFSGLIYAHQLGITIGQCIDDLELICGVFDLADIENRVVYLPL